MLDFFNMTVGSLEVSATHHGHKLTNNIDWKLATSVGQMLQFCRLVKDDKKKNKQNENKIITSCDYQTTKLLSHLMGFVGIKNDILSALALEKLVLWLSVISSPLCVWGRAGQVSVQALPQGFV